MKYCPCEVGLTLGQGNAVRVASATAKSHCALKGKELALQVNTWVGTL